MKSMRRIERQMDRDKAIILLIEGEYGILSTSGKDNIPYGIPISYILKENNLYFHCALEGSKLDKISENSKVCFTVVGKTKILPDKFSTEYESVIVFGTASIASGPEKRMALLEIIKKYSPAFIDEGNEYIERAQDKTIVVKIEIEELTGKHRI
jgi:uncharacterized protein